MSPTCKNTGVSTMAPWSVLPKQYGLFLIHIFNEWIKRDVGKYFIQIFDTTLANQVGAEAGLCSFSKYCGFFLAIEHNGDVYSCDHFVYPQNRLGNIQKNSFPGLLFSPQQQKFGLDKSHSLPVECESCDVYDYCYGECPKNRIVESKSGIRNLNYLCDDYKLFFKYVRPFMNFMGKELKNQRSPANVMVWAKNRKFCIPDS